MKKKLIPLLDKNAKTQTRQVETCLNSGINYLLFFYDSNSVPYNLRSADLDDTDRLLEIDKFFFKHEYVCFV